jgi:ferritin-like metal-binding protein YciE
MSLLTVRDVEGWVGHAAQDPEGEPLGTVAECLLDRETGAPEWLLIAEQDGQSEGVLAPVYDAATTGRQVRVAALAEKVRTGPRIGIGKELDMEGKRRAAEHYGLILDTDVSPTGRLRPPQRAQARGHAEPAETPPVAAASGGQRERLIAALREAHAMEQESLKRLAAMRWRVHDEELVHDVALHHKETNRHAAMLRNRLGELDAIRMRPRDWAAKVRGYLQAQLGRVRSYPDPADARAAYAFEQHELQTYRDLERLAREIGDERTATLARRIAADEQAMACTLAASRMWADPGQSRDRPSPFTAPAELQEGVPGS